MRKGWKTRIEERRYFEEKKEEREQKAMIFRMMQARFLQQMQAEMEQRDKHEIN